ncbi:MAG: recombinase zinc beta ribbon domain-containing protein [Phycisphaerales bacterium]
MCRLIGRHVYHSHEMTFAGGFAACAHCGKVVTGEQVTKKTKSGERRYVYYRCSRYTAEGHPRVRLLPEKELDRQLMAVFDSIDSG